MIVIYKTDTMRSFNSGIQEEIDKFLESSDPSTFIYYDGTEVLDNLSTEELELYKNLKKIVFKSIL